MNPYAKEVSLFSAKFMNFAYVPGKNLVSSPVMVELLLGLLALGSKDPSQLIDVMHLGSNKDQLKVAFKKVSGAMQNIKGVTFYAANKLYVKECDSVVMPAFKKEAVHAFWAEVEKVDFDMGPVAADIISTWVEKITKGLIKDIIDPSTIESNTQAVMVNGLYFKGKWEKEFDPLDTETQTFHVSSSTAKNVQMMSQEETFKYGNCSALSAQLLELNYSKGKASMLIVLPKEVEGLKNVLRLLSDGYDLVSERGKMKPTRVQVRIPKFAIESDLDLSVLLPKMGVSSIFSSSAGITQILGNNESLEVSKGVQKAFLEVDEEGSKAASSSAFKLIMVSENNDMELFVADHPFLAVLFVNELPIFWACFTSPDNTTKRLVLNKAPIRTSLDKSENSQENSKSTVVAYLNNLCLLFIWIYFIKLL
ncbi:antichymotrypsin-2 isoform X2 [Plutella xylostella]|nr:antichymotrypsin-2 isoform X2 [Plutella xylostella]XP_037964221.1 antichymotrypsin-2 isoform X2 [Plutella xylostella]